MDKDKAYATPIKVILLLFYIVYGKMETVNADTSFHYTAVLKCSLGIWKLKEQKKAYWNVNPQKYGRKMFVLKNFRPTV